MVLAHPPSQLLCSWGGGGHSCDNDIRHRLWRSSLPTYACASLVGEGGMVCLPWVLPLPLLLILLYLYYPCVSCRPAVRLVFTVPRGSR